MNVNTDGLYHENPGMGIVTNLLRNGRVCYIVCAKRAAAGQVLTAVRNRRTVYGK